MWFTISICQFEALRKPALFLGWLLVAILYLVVYLMNLNHSKLLFKDDDGIFRNHATLLLIPFCLLLIFQLCRQVSLFFYEKELKITTDSDSTGIEKLCRLVLLIMPMAIYYFTYHFY